ncbi:MAG: tRNA dihydrouridine(20/20a) synthase DusA [Legionellaceae bacterium]|nr:tRNA dihydrouridine(20/20a) synthase DusA [Legionellaceae bacterium]
MLMNNVNHGRAPLFSPLSIAPMIDWTYPQFRYVMRLLAPRALLYTEMQTTGAILHQPQRALAYDVTEHPIALQLGGSDPEELAHCAQMAEQQGFDEINLNLGCPSDRVQSGHFGACLMADAERVARCIESMKKAVSIPVSAKTRIGIDEQDSYEFFANFAQKLIEAGVDKLVIHARKAWLKGLSPKQNRTIPPINYERVYQLKRQYPQIPMVVNGNIDSVVDMQAHLQTVDGIMLGRLACKHPYALCAFHHQLYPDDVIPTRAQLIGQWVSYAQDQAAQGISLSLLVKPVLNLAHGLAHARLWKSALANLIQCGHSAQWEELIELMRQLESSNHGILTDFLVN